MSWKQEFYNLLSTPNVADLQIERAQAIKIANLPKFLYKYRPASEYAIQNLESDTVWLNKPSVYNDPFEFVEYLDFNNLNKFYNDQNEE